MNKKKDKDVPPTILVVELDDDTRLLLKQNLRNHEYHVLVAIEEEDAIALRVVRAIGLA